MVTRRGALAATAAIAALSACRPGNGPPAAPGPADPGSLRSTFAIDPELAHFAAYVFASHPQPVRSAIDRHRQGLDKDPFSYLDQYEQRLDEAVARAAAEYLSSTPGQIAFTDSTTMGLGLLYSGLKLAAGDEILTTDHDFWATHESLRLRQQRDGVTVRRTWLYADPVRATDEEILTSMRAALTPAVKVVAITWVHSGTGVRLPVTAIADLVRERSPDALVCLDAVHGFGIEPATPAELGCDFLVSGGHKWLFGPRGTGVVWGSPRGWERFTPVIPTFDRNTIAKWMGFSTPAAPAGVLATPGGYHAFEHRWALAEAFDFHRNVGRRKVHEHTVTLAAALRSGLAGIRGVTLVTPERPSSGIVCCEIGNLTPDVAVDRLRQQKVIASITPYQRRLVRFGPSLATDARDVERALTAVRTLV